VKKPLSQYFGTDSSPLGGAPKVWCKKSPVNVSRCFSLAVRTTANSVNVRACYCAHSSRATKTAHCAVLIMWHSSHFVKEGNLISRFATASPIGEACVRLRHTRNSKVKYLEMRRVAPRSFGVAQDDKVGKCALRRMTRQARDNNKVGVFASQKISRLRSRPQGARASAKPRAK
jgi:hypothetical protein